MRLDDEKTAVQLYALLLGKGYNISLLTILRARSALGWSSAYCQLIREANKRRLDWPNANLTYRFLDVIP